MKKRPGLKVITTSWVPKGRTKDDGRPLTATLDEPKVLDAKFAGKVDMSLLRKEFLNISNLCRVPATAKLHKKSGLYGRRRNGRPRSLPGGEKVAVAKRSKRVESNEDSWEDDESTVSLVNLLLF